jgi:hypothetical protein
MSAIPQVLNWVEKRAACTVAAVFNQLCDGIIDDVEAINSVRQLDDDDRFSADMHSGGTTIFVGQSNRIPRMRLTIGVASNRIEVRQEWDGVTWFASVGLNDEGRCILRFDDKEWEQWQFRKKALEGLFFGD